MPATASSETSSRDREEKQLGAPSSAKRIRWQAGIISEPERLWNRFPCSRCRWGVSTAWTALKCAEETSRKLICVWPVSGSILRGHDSRAKELPHGDRNGKRHPPHPQNGPARCQRPDGWAASRIVPGAE